MFDIGNLISEKVPHQLKWKRSRLLTFLLISCLLIGCNKSPDQVADHFLGLLVAGKHLEVQGMLSKDMKSMAGLFGGVSNQSLNLYYRQGVFKSYKLTQLEMTQDSVRYKVAAITTDGATYEDFLDLIQEDGEWKISRF